MIQPEEFKEKWNTLREKARPTLEKTGVGMQKVKQVCAAVWKWIYRLRKIVFSIPIVWAAVYLARMNQNALPETVGIGLQITGEYAMYITRQEAVLGPLGATAACLLLMFLSRKTLYPWLVCVISLALPLLLLVTNTFPG